MNLLGRRAMHLPDRGLTSEMARHARVRLARTRLRGRLAATPGKIQNIVDREAVATVMMAAARLAQIAMLTNPMPGSLCLRRGQLANRDLEERSLLRDPLRTVAEHLLVVVAPLVPGP